MKKLLQLFRDNSLLLITLGLIVFIPLYPKLPVLDVRHTWVYIRAEDFVVLFILLFWGFQAIRNAVYLRTPLTVPIFFFWIIGIVATTHGVLLIFPKLTDAHPNVAFLSMLRRIEYMGLFFVAFRAVREKRFLRIVVLVLAATVLTVSIYGLGQKYLGFPAFLTMNEEFAKGIPIQLSQLSRVSSTFSGHYDLAAYLVLTIPILISMAFGLPNMGFRVFLLFVSSLAFVVLFMTVSRISLLALFLALGGVVFAQNKKLFLLCLPISVLVGIFILSASPRILDRFGNTVKEIDVLVDAGAGEAIGHSRGVPNTYFANKQVKQVFSRSVNNIYAYASPSAALVIPYTRLEAEAVLFVEPNAPTGENLPQGTGYINLPLSPVTRKLGHFYFEPIPGVATTSADVFIINGNFLIKKALAYDLSFTTRFQGEWPRALDAFKRNILIGSGYGSVGLAVDNSFLRMLGEVGLLGLGAFLTVLGMAAMYIRRVIRDVDSREVRSFLIGIVAGVGGLSVNALFIDVFEASKVAFTLWLLLGIALGVLGLYERRSPDVYKALKAIATSPFAIIVYLLVLTAVLYSPMTQNNFVGDDFTWLRWAATGTNSRWYEPFLNAAGFFYRPGAKLYFTLMYSIFWLNQSAYHTVSLTLHFVVAALVFFLAKKLFNRTLFAFLSAVAFLIGSGNTEPVFWVSATGFLFTAVFSLGSLLSYIFWEEKKKTLYLYLALASLVFSMLFHELGIVTPFLLLLYKTIFLRNARFPKILLLPLPLYFVVRYISQSHWLSGDYSYNLAKLPFNVVGNALGYALLTLFGPSIIPFMETARNLLKEHVAVAIPITIVLAALIFVMYMKYIRRLPVAEKRIVLFAVCFFIISLLPFLGLGNMTTRYGYLSSVGVIFILVYAFQKLYQALLGNGRTIAMLAIATIVGALGLFQLISQQAVQRDWYEAGEKTRRFIVSLDAAFEDSWVVQPIELHFVNIPIRERNAWVFPVGLQDALWLIFRNSKIRVFSWGTVEAAFEAVEYDSAYQRVFEFDPSGKLMERKKTRNL